jgi:hypothetical protein
MWHQFYLAVRFCRCNVNIGYFGREKEEAVFMPKGTDRK